MAVIALTARIAPICSLFSVYDGFQAVMGGVFRGLGRQAMIAKMNLFSFWAIGVPVGYGLCFKAGLGVSGLWWGLSIGLGVLAIIYIVLWFRIDWDKEAAKAGAGGEATPLLGGGKGGTPPPTPTFRWNSSAPPTPQRVAAVVASQSPAREHANYLSVQ